MSQLVVSTDRNEADGHGAATSPLGAMLDLDDGEVAVLEKVFVEASEALGIHGAPVLARLAAGRTMGEALDLPPGTVELLYARAHQWFTAGRPDRAEQLFRAVCVLDGTNADSWVGFGVCLRLRDSFEAAAIAFDMAAGCRPAWAVPQFHALELATRRGDWPEADRRLAAFDERRDGSVPDALVAEADRIRSAMSLRRERAGP
jgi:hypothetical protein